tara:strand:+ start:4891 stop:5745 length:855 start_codon:yes stop_codon:yes gene_type:complete
MYYPKSQIKINLYTAGNEYYLVSTKQPYKGYYYVVSGNSYLTGRNPSEGKNEQLSKIPPPTPEDTDGVFPSNEIIVQNRSYESMDVGNVRNNQIYNISPKTTVLSNRTLPTPFSPLPTSKDYILGEFQRYFCKKNNEIKYMEISKKTFQDLQNNEPFIAFDIFTPFSIPWSISGEEKQVFNTNKNISTLIERNSSFYGFIFYLKNDWLKYYKNPTQENLYTDGGEYTTKNGKKYIGDYHIHLEKGPMVGATHIKSPHDYLYPITQTTGSIKQSQTPPILGEGGY